MILVFVLTQLFYCGAAPMATACPPEPLGVGGSGFAASAAELTQLYRALDELNLTVTRRELALQALELSELFCAHAKKIAGASRHELRHVATVILRDVTPVRELLAHTALGVPLLVRGTLYECTVRECTIDLVRSMSELDLERVTEDIELVQIACQQLAENLRDIARQLIADAQNYEQLCAYVENLLLPDRLERWIMPLREVAVNGHATLGELQQVFDGCAQLRADMLELRRLVCPVGQLSTLQVTAIVRAIDAFTASIDHDIVELKVQTIDAHGVHGHLLESAQKIVTAFDLLYTELRVLNAEIMKQ